jgi:hypothetical protein
MTEIVIEDIPDLVGSTVMTALEILAVHGFVVVVVLLSIATTHVGAEQRIVSLKQRANLRLQGRFGKEE